MRKITFPALTAAELADAGQALFGVHWRGELARALGLADDSLIRAVESGRMEAPAEWRARLIAIAQDAALRAMDAASALLSYEIRSEEAAPGYATPRLV
jgi:hypothetical protein